jgi:hypothetical protein
MRYPIAIGLFAMLPGCVTAPALTGSAYERCDVDSNQWSVIQPSPGDAGALVAIVKQHRGAPDDEEKEIFWFASNHGNAVLLCSAAHQSSYVSPNCFSNRWTLVNTNNTWSLAKDKNGYDMVDSTICVD